MEVKITAQRVSNPRASRKWIEAEDGVYYSFWGSEVWGKDEVGEPLHGQLIAHEEYEIEYEVNDKGYNNVKSIKRLTYKATGEIEVPEQEEETAMPEKEKKVGSSSTTTIAEGALVPFTPTVKELVVRPQISPEEAIKLWEQFQQFKVDLLDENDYVYYVEHGKNKPQGFKTKEEANAFNVKQYKSAGKVIGRIKKSGWRKFAQAFNLSVQVLKEVVLPSPPAPTKYAKYWVLVTAPNGRTMTGTGVCSLNERGFAHQDHDIVATAMTRAVNRGVSDMIAAGEVSAEEIGAGNSYEKFPDHKEVKTPSGAVVYVPKKKIKTAKDVVEVIEEHHEELAKKDVGFAKERKKLKDFVEGEIVGEKEEETHGKSVSDSIVDPPVFTTTDPISKERFQEIKDKVKQVAELYTVTQTSIFEDLADRFSLNKEGRTIKRFEISNEKSDELMEYLEGQL